MKICNKNLSGQKLNFPIVGVQEIGEDGILEIEDSIAQSLIESGMGWVSAEPKKVSEDEEEGGKVEEGEKSGDEKSEEELQIEKAIEDLQAMPLSTLVEMATASGYAEEEWVKFSKNVKNPEKLMIAYLTKKIKG
jgi:hypothetical protein